jgi:hypothetical protein
MDNGKKSIILGVTCMLVFVCGFFLGRLSDRGRIPGTAEYHQNIGRELESAAETYSGIEENFEGAGSGIAAGIERAGNVASGIAASLGHAESVGRGLDGIEGYAVENTKLLGRAYRILLNAGERKGQAEE